MKNKTVSIRMDVDLIKKVAKASKEDSRTISSYINNLLKNKLIENEK